MKSISKFFLGMCAIGLLTLVSCNKSDDDGPSKSADPGIFKGTLTDPKTGASSEWVATFTEAKHDTLTNEVRITAKNAGGDVIMILLSSVETGMYSLFQNTSNESTFQSSTFSGVATTRSNDVPTSSGPKESKIQITDNGDTDGKLRGVLHTVHWYTVGPEIDDDVRVGLFSMPGEEFEIPLTKGANMGGSGQANLTAKINDVTFNPTIIQAMGFILTATNITESITIQLPNNATVGTHDFSSGFSAYNVTYMAGESIHNMSGTINLVEFNSIAGTATGTFEATATPTGGGDSVSITSGTFRF